MAEASGRAASSERAPVGAAASALPGVDSGTSALLTDHYELTMLQAALESGTADRRCVFSVFARGLPDGRRYGVAAGTGRVLEELARFRFDAGTLDFLSAAGVVDDRTCAWLADYRFGGDIDGYAEGEAYFPHSPVLVVQGSFGECVLLETLILSILNHDSAIASAAARMVCAAGERPCIEMGSRRTHERSAVAASRAACLVGFTATSNLEAGRRYGVATTGTSAHAFTLLHDSEDDAFRAQIAALGPETTLLVDTYDVMAAVRSAVDIAGPKLGAVRLDSGDLLSVADDVRKLLDSLGAEDTRIIVTSDLDEYAIAALATAPVDGYGVGTSVVTGSRRPTAGMVFKLVARATSPDPDAPLLPVAKRSPGKSSTGGRPYAVRRFDEHGHAAAEVIVTGGRPPARADERPLQVPLVRGGEIVASVSIAEAQEAHRRAMAELPPHAMQLSKGEPAIPTVFLDAADGDGADA
jgi:nicotinate phosphoribosyltransferase